MQYTHWTQWFEPFGQSFNKRNSNEFFFCFSIQLSATIRHTWLIYKSIFFLNFFFDFHLMLFSVVVVIFTIQYSWLLIFWCLFFFPHWDQCASQQHSYELSLSISTSFFPSLLSHDADACWLWMSVLVDVVPSSSSSSSSSNNLRANFNASNSL